MIKMGKTKYLYNGKSLTCNDINRKLKATKKVTYSKKFKQYFDAQTAFTSIVMLEYSLLSLAKKELEYQTIGGIFKDIQKDTQTPILDECILLIIKELVLNLAEILEIPFEELITKIISENKQINLYFNCITRLKSRGKPVFLILSLFQKLITQAIGRLRTTWAT